MSVVQLFQSYNDSVYADVRELLAYFGNRWSRILSLGIQAYLGACAGRIVLQCIKVRRKREILKDVPFAAYDRSSFWGSLKAQQQNSHRLLDWRKEVTDGLPVSKVFGPPFGDFGTALMIRDAVNVKHVLKDSFDIYTKTHSRKNPGIFYVNKWLGKGIFTVMHGPQAPDGGKSWALQRKISANIFNRGNFNNLMHNVFAAKAAIFKNCLVKPADEGTKVDFQEMAFGYTMDSISQIFFGEESNSLGGTPSVYGSAYDEAHQSVTEYLMTSMAFLTFTQECLLWPLGGVEGLLWKIHRWCNPTYGKFSKALQTLDFESRRLVEAIRSDPKRAERKELMALFVAQEEKESFSVEFLRDMALNFVIAGRDTTACLLSWVVYELCVSPEVQDKLCLEIDQKLPSGTVPTLKQLSAAEMPYLNGVIYEALRMHPSVPMLSKTATRDDTLPDGTPVPEGTNVQIHPWSMGRDAGLYAKPDVFKPERWMDRGGFSMPDSYEFPVFQAGPRICLGMDMAIFEAKLLISMLFEDYKFELLPGEAEKIRPGRGFTMAVANSDSTSNLWVIPKLRGAVEV